MPSTEYLPFGIHSIAPGLEGLHPLHRNTSDGSVPNCLRLSEASKEAMSLHVKQVGLERRYYDYSVKDQGAKLTKADNPVYQTCTGINSFFSSPCTDAILGALAVHSEREHMRRTIEILSSEDSHKEYHQTETEQGDSNLPMPVWCRSHHGSICRRNTSNSMEECWLSLVDQVNHRT